MMTMMMMMIDDILSPYMYLPDVPYLPSASCLLLFALAVAALTYRTTYLPHRSSAAALGSRMRAKEIHHVGPCRGDRTPDGGRTCLMSEFGGVFRLCRLQVMCRTQSHTHPHNHNHTLTPTPTPTLSLSHFDTAPTPPYTTPRRRGGEATLFWHRHRCDVPNNANGRQQRGRTRHEGACIVPHSCP